MFLWRLKLRHCINSISNNETCINTIETAMQLVHSSTLPRRHLPLISRLAVNATLVVVTWEQRRRTRRDLRSLTAHMLADIGVDPQVAARESEKPFWVA
jgi:uncharacterized protein YjiS (DUF1127 family)